ncbi:MAG: hypothetical protein WD688_01195 [Candidatus Binatia bacterium]
MFFDGSRALELIGGRVYSCGKWISKAGGEIKRYKNAILFVATWLMTLGGFALAGRVVGQDVVTGGL